LRTAINQLTVLAFAPCKLSEKRLSICALPIKSKLSYHLRLANYQQANNFASAPCKSFFYCIVAKSGREKNQDQGSTALIRNQGCGSGSVLDPYSIGSVDPDPYSDPDPDPGGQT
jgi:hypothetical protein